MRGGGADARVLSTAALLVAAVAAPVMSNRSIVPLRLAIYYGIPSLVNGAGGDTVRAAAVFSAYDIVVFGDGLQFADVVRSRRPVGPGAIEHRRTREIIDRLSGGGQVAVFGYVDIGRSQQLDLDDIRRRLALWRQMGVAGVLLDEAGKDFGVTRERQNAVVDAAHRLGLRVIMNAYNPDDVFAAADGDHGLRAGDAYLLESFLVKEGQPEAPRAWLERTQRALRYARAAGVDVYAVTTTVGSERFPDALLQYAWWGAVISGVDAFGWGEPAFSGPDSQLPWRQRPALSTDDRFTGDLEPAGDIFRRPTARGWIELDVANRTGGFRPRP